MDTWSNNYSRPTTSAEQMLYDHLLHCVESEPPEQLIARFHQLFVDGIGYSDYAVWRAVKKLVASRLAERDFKFILNRCCYIPINHWLMQPRLHSYIPQLIATLDATPSGCPRAETSKRIRHLVSLFSATEQYLALKRLAQVIQQTVEQRALSGEVLLGGLIHRYPCLYEHTLLTDDSLDEQRKRVRRLRRQFQQQFEIELSQYITHRQLRRSDALQPVQVSGVFQNPTLLSDRQLDSALSHFTGRVDGYNTHRDLARQFLTYTRDTRCFRTFKNELYEYLIDSVDTKYGTRQFNQSLYSHLQLILPENDDHRMNDVLLVTTCRKLLNFLIVDSIHQPNHFIFSDLTANLGITSTIGLLLKVVLLCSRVRCHLEKRFSILFSHYESCASDAVRWLVEALENLNVALSTNFGSIILCQAS